MCFKSSETCNFYILTYIHIHKLVFFLKGYVVVIIIMGFDALGIVKGEKREKGEKWID